jgi:DNA polymerase III delta subunit
VGGARRELTPGPALKQALGRGVPPVVAFVGEEDFLKEEGLRQVREALGGADLEAFDGPRTANEAKSFDATAVFDALRTGSLFGGSRVLVVRRADAFLEAMVDALARLLADPGGAATLVLFLDRLDGRTRFARLLSEKGLRVACRRLYDRPAPWQRGRVPPHEHELAQWTVIRARRHGKRMSLEVAHGLTEHTGNDLGRIAGALETLTVFVGEAPEIGRDAVERLVGGHGEQTVFRLCDEVLDRDGPASVKTLARTFREGLELGGRVERRADGIALIVVSWLGRRFREMLSARRALEEGRPRAEVTRDHGPKQRGLVSTFERHLERYDSRALGRAIGGLRRLELDLKTGRAPGGAEIALLAFLAETCARPPRRGRE